VVLTASVAEDSDLQGFERFVTLVWNDRNAFMFRVKQSQKFLPFFALYDPEEGSTSPIGICRQYKQHNLPK